MYAPSQPNQTPNTTKPIGHTFSISTFFYKRKSLDRFRVHKNWKVWCMAKEKQKWFFCLFCCWGYNKDSIWFVRRVRIIQQIGWNGCNDSIHKSVSMSFLLCCFAIGPAARYERKLWFSERKCHLFGLNTQ